VAEKGNCTVTEQINTLGGKGVLTGKGRKEGQEDFIELTFFYWKLTLAQSRVENNLMAAKTFEKSGIAEVLAENIYMKSRRETEIDTRSSSGLPIIGRERE